MKHKKEQTENFISKFFENNSECDFRNNASINLSNDQWQKNWNKWDNTTLFSVPSLGFCIEDVMSWITWFSVLYSGSLFWKQRANINSNHTLIVHMDEIRNIGHQHCWDFRKLPISLLCPLNSARISLSKFPPLKSGSFFHGNQC